jgi:hypothetical protein
MPLRAAASRLLTLLVAILAGGAFTFALIWLLYALGSLEAGLAQLSHAGPASIHFFYIFAVPVLDASICGLLIGLTFKLVGVESLWLHVAAFLFAFEFVEMRITGARMLTQLIVAAPFMWLFPLITCLVILLSQGLKRKSSVEA